MGTQALRGRQDSIPFNPRNLLPAAYATTAAMSQTRSLSRTDQLAQKQRQDDHRLEIRRKRQMVAEHEGPADREGDYEDLAMGRDTAGLAGFIASAPENAGLRDMDARMVIQAGGLPIRMGEALVGGIGVGGAPSGDIDATCATAGLTAIGAAQ